jgi:hypothetical protein
LFLQHRKAGKTHFPPSIILSGSSTEEEYVFCYSFCLTNANIVEFFQGDDTPSHADSSTLRKNGKHRVNTAQNLPRASVELKENSPEHQMIIEVLGPVFEWINQLVRNSISIYVLSTNLFSVERTSS